MIYFEISQPIGNCCLCNKKAEVVFIKKGFFSYKLRMFCDEHSKLYSNVKQDI